MIKKILCFLFVINSFAYSEVTLKTKSYYKNQWETDSVFIGSDIIVKDSNKEVIVKYWKINGFNAIGELHFMIPEKDSSKFLFHNLREKFPNEDTIINLGKFPEGTKLYFMYMNTDTAARWEKCKFKKTYTGQNIINSDKYISEIESPNYGKRWAAVEQIDESLVNVGFSDCANSEFDKLFFKVFNAVLKR